MPKKHTDDFQFILNNISEELHPFISDHYSTWNLMDDVRKEFSMMVYQQALDRISEELNEHFVKEEVLLLPVLKGYLTNNEVGPVAKLKDEHQSIKTKYNEVNNSFNEYKAQQSQKHSALQDHTEFEESLMKQMNLLAYLVKKHIEKEDHYFYPFLSLVLNKEEKKKISAKLEIKK